MSDGKGARLGISDQTSHRRHRDKPDVMRGCDENKPDQPPKGVRRCEAENIYFYSREVMGDTVIKPDQLVLTRQITRNKWHHSQQLMSSQEATGSPGLCKG